MPKSMFDAEALMTMFENATARGGEQLQQATTQATMAALQGRELTLANMRSALKSVTAAVNTGAAKNAVADPQALLDQAVAGMDAALLKAVEANRTALTSLMAQGADMREKHLSKALSDLEKMEDTMFAAIRKAAEGAGGQMAGAWGPVLEKMQASGTQTGAQATSTAQQMAARMTEQMQNTVRDSRAASMRAAQALAEGYTAMVSGVLLGMSQALQAEPPAAKKKALNDRAAPRGHRCRIADQPARDRLALPDPHRVRCHHRFTRPAAEGPRKGRALGHRCQHAPAAR